MNNETETPAADPAIVPHAIRPFHESILVKHYPIPDKVGLIILPGAKKFQPIYAKVLAVGEGPACKAIKVGDEVLLMCGLNDRKTYGTRVIYKGEQLFIHSVGEIAYMATSDTFGKDIVIDGSDALSEGEIEIRFPVPNMPKPTFNPKNQSN